MFIDIKNPAKTADDFEHLKDIARGRSQNAFHFSMILFFIHTCSVFFISMDAGLEYILPTLIIMAGIGVFTMEKEYIPSWVVADTTFVMVVAQFYFTKVLFDASGMNTISIGIILGVALLSLMIGLMQWTVGYYIPFRCIKSMSMPATDEQIDSLNVHAKNNPSVQHYISSIRCLVDQRDLSQYEYKKLIKTRG